MNNVPFYLRRPGQQQKYTPMPWSSTPMSRLTNKRNLTTVRRGQPSPLIQANRQFEKDVRRHYTGSPNTKLRQYANDMQYDINDERLRNAEWQRNLDYEKFKSEHQYGQRDWVTKAMFNLRSFIGQTADAVFEGRALLAEGKQSLNNRNIMLAERYKEYLQYQDQYNNLRDQLSAERRGTPNYNRLSRQLLDITKRLKDPALINDVNGYKQVKESSSIINQIGNYLKPLLQNQSGIEGQAYRDYLQSDTYNKINDPIKLYDANHVGMDNKSLIAQADKDINDGKVKLKTNIQDYDDAIKSQDDWRKYWDISPSVRKNQQVYQDQSLFSPYYYIGGFPNTLGSTIASPSTMKSYALRAAGAVAGATIGALAGGVGAVPGAIAGWNVGNVAAIPSMVEAGLDENYMEIGDRYLDNIQAQLSHVKNKDNLLKELQTKSKQYWKNKGLSEQWINEHTDIKNDAGIRNILKDALNGNISTNNPAFNRAKLNATKGLQAQFEADNLRTMYSIPIDLWTNQLGPISKMFKPFSSVVTKVATNAGNKIGKALGERFVQGTAASRFRNGFTKKTASELFNTGFQRGSEAASTLGLGASSLIVGAAAGTANVAKTLIKEAMPKSVKRAADAIEESVMHYYGKGIDAISKIPGNRLLKFVGNAGKKLTVAASNEMAEEGVQYMNSKKDFASEYGYRGAPISDLIVDDASQGVRYAKSILSYLGLGHSEFDNDKEYWANLKGALALTGVNTGVIQTAYNAYGAYKEYSTQNYIARNAVLAREQDKQNRLSNEAIARAVISNHADGVIEELQRQRDRDKLSENPNYTQEQYDDQIKQVNLVSNVANQQNIRRKLEAKGILYGTDRYASAVADIVTNLQALDENKQARQENDTKIKELKSKRIIENAIRNATDAEFSPYEQTDDELLDGYDSFEDAERAGVSDVIEQRTQYRQQDIQGKTRVTESGNKLIALLKLRQKLNTMSDYMRAMKEAGLSIPTSDKGTITSTINRLIDRAKEDYQRANAQEYGDVVNTDKDDYSLIDDIRKNNNYVNDSSEDYQRLYTNDALLNMDRAVTNSKLNQLNYGLIDKNGNLVYDPREYEFQQQEQKRKAQFIRKEAQKKRNNPDYQVREYEATPHAVIESEDKPDKDPFVKRIDKIRTKEDENSGLEWAVSATANGELSDDITYDQLANEAESARQQYVSEQDQTIFDRSIEEQNQAKLQLTKEQDKQTRDALAEQNRSKFLNKINNAKREYIRRKNKIKNWRNGMAMVNLLPFQDHIPDLANYIAFQAQVGFYKFSQFVNELKSIYGDKEVNDNIGFLKQQYNAVKLASPDDNITNNLDNPQQILDYDTNEVKTDTTPSVSVKQSLTRLREDQSKIIPQVSGFYSTFVNEDDGIVIYRNVSSELLRLPGIANDYTYNSIKQILNDKDFDSAIAELNKKFATDFFTKYKPYAKVDGIKDAMALDYVEHQKKSSNNLRRADSIRTLVQSIFTRSDEDVDSIISSDDSLKVLEQSGIDSLRSQIIEYRNELNKAGYSIVATSPNIYGVDMDYNPISAQLDILLVDNKGRYTVINVVTSQYQNIYGNRTKNPYSGAIYTNIQRYNQEFDNVHTILRSKYGIDVQDSRILTVFSDGSVIELERPDNDYTYSINQDRNTQNIAPYTTLSSLQKTVSQIVSDINNKIDDINQAVQQLRSQTENSGYALQTKITDNADKYRSSTGLFLYNLTLRDQSIKLGQLLDEINDKLQSLSNKQLDESFDPVEVDPAALADLYEFELDARALYEAADRLDNAMDNNAYQSIAQNALTLQNTLNSLINNGFDVDQFSDIQDLIFSAMEKVRIRLTNRHTDTDENLRGLSQSYLINSLYADTSNAAYDAYGNRLSKGADAVYYLRKISQWSSIKDRALDIPNNSTILKNWYDQLLHGPFQDLLNKAEEYNRTINDSTLGQNIKSAQQFITQFDSKYGVHVAPINRPYVTKKKQTNTGSILLPTRQSMSNGILTPGVVDRNGSNAQFFHMSLLPNFENAVKYKLLVQNDNLYIDLSCDNYSTRLLIDSTSSNQDTFNIVKAKVLNGENVNLKITKLFSQFQLLKNQSANVNAWLFAQPNNTHDLYNIKLGINSRIGILQYTQSTDNWAIITGTEILKSGNRAEYPQFCNLYNGSLVYLYNDGRITQSKYKYTPVGLTVPRFTETQARVLTEYLYDATNGNSKIAVGNGAAQIDVLNLLKSLLYVQDGTKRITPRNSDRNVLTINAGTIRVNQINNGADYRMTSRRDPNVINYFMSISPNMDEQSLNTNINKLASTSDADNSSRNEIIKVSKQLLQTGKYYTVEIFPGFKLSRDDFEVNGGRTLLGYYLQNGIIGSNVKGLKYQPIQIEVIEDRPTRSVESTTEHDAKQASPASRKSSNRAINNLLNMFGSLDYTKKRGERPSDFENIANEYLDKVLGKNRTQNFEEANKIFMAAAARNPRVLGICTDQGIILSQNAPEEAIYHEAFHMIVELTMDPKDREHYYELYRKYNGNGLSERDVAEGLADMFTDYMYNKQAIRNTKGFDKFFKWCKGLLFHMGMYFRYGRSWNEYLYLYNSINKGNYANRAISPEANERFKQMFNTGLYYTVTNTNTGVSREFQYLNNIHDVKQMADGLAYLILKKMGKTAAIPNQDMFKVSNITPNMLGDNIISILTGSNKDEKDLTDNDLAFREVFKSVTNDNGTKTYTNFPALTRYISDSISSLINGYSGRLSELDENEDDDIDRVVKDNIDKYDANAYEFSKLDQTTVAAKLFFGTIPYYIRDNSGKLTVDLSKNKFGLPTFMPLQQVYTTIANEFHDVTDAEDLYNKLEKAQVIDALHQAVFDKYKAIYDKQGTSGDGVNAETLITQILGLIKTQKNKFMIFKFEKDAQSDGIMSRMLDTMFDRDTMSLPRRWSQNLTSGQTGLISRFRDKNGNYVFEDGVDENSLLFPIQLIATIRDKFIQEYSLSGSKDHIILNGREYKFDNVDDINIIKRGIIQALSVLGIQIDDYTVNYLFRSKYKDTGSVGLYKWLTESGLNSFQLFAERVNSFVENGVLNTKNLDKGYSGIGFLKNLATYKGLADRNRKTSSVLTFDGKHANLLSQNNTISITCDHINRNDENDEILNLINRYEYTSYNRNGIIVGSIISKALIRHDDFTINPLTILGSKTDNYGDKGNKYLDQQTPDDWMSKFKALQEGCILFPTLADKSTYVVLQITNGVDSDVHVPGMTLVKQFNPDRGTVSYAVSNIPSLTKHNTGDGTILYLTPTDAVLNQMLEYAYTEYQSIIRNGRDLGLIGHNKVVTPTNAVKNLHTSKRGQKFLWMKYIIIPSGVQLTDGTALTEDKKIDLSTDDIKKNLQNAYYWLFSQPEDIQRQIMARTMNIQINLELKKAIDLGIITGETDKDGIVNILSLKSDYLDNNQIESISTIYKDMLNILKADRYYSTQDINNFAHSLAIAALITDAGYRSQISLSETIRWFIGNPAFFKNSPDFQKRIGSLISTGDDNRLNLKGIPTKYNCAEVKDYYVGLPDDGIEQIHNMFYEGELREQYAEYIDDYNKAFNMPVEEIEKDLTQRGNTSVLTRSKANADKFTNAYKKDDDNEGINVADGASYITEDMCENLLRSRGAYDDDVKRAFQVLRDDDGTKFDSRTSYEAYRLIYERVQLVTTKYTAYGVRPHPEIPNLPVTYLNKFAMFPLFKSIATGKLATIYTNMKDQGVDNLLMDSAIKIGSEGSVKWNGTEFNKPFHVYPQYYEFLRRQLNTDPEEGETMHLGTQMVKVGLSNLRLGRTYKNTTTGEEISGEQLFKTYMNSINALTDFGYKAFTDQFSTNGKYDIHKLSDFLKDQMSSRDANINILSALDVVEDEHGAHLKIPLSAISNSNLIESVLISNINKNIIDIMTPGNSFVQRSVFAMEGKPGKGAIKGAEIYNGKELQMINEEGSMDAVISIDYFESILPKNDPNIQSFAEKRQWLIDNNIIGPNAKANTIGYRIPTQAQSSIHALRFVDVCPTVCSTIILPKAFTKITGSDKQYQCSNQYNIKNRVNCWELVIKTTISSQAHKGRFND